MEKKCLVIGGSRSGKTCLLSVLKDGVFPEKVEKDVMGSFKLVEKGLTIEFIDTTPQVYSKPYKGVDLILVCFDICDSYSFSDAMDHFREARDKKPFAHYIMVGTMSDLKESKGDEEKESLEFARIRENLGFPYLECSALKQEGIKELLEKIVEILPTIAGPTFTKDVVEDKMFLKEFIEIVKNQDFDSVEFLLKKMKSQDVFQYFLSSIKPEESPLLKANRPDMFLFLISHGILQDYNLCLYYLICNEKISYQKDNIASNLFELGGNPNSTVKDLLSTKEENINLMKLVEGCPLENVFKNESSRRKEAREQIEKENLQKVLNQQTQDIQQIKDRLRTLEDKMDLIINLLKK